MKGALFFLGVSVLLTGTASANPVYPGTTFLTATSWEGETAVTESGFGFRSEMAVENLPFKSFVGGINFGYRWLNNAGNRTGNMLSIPNAGLSAGYRFHLRDLVSLTPLIGGSFGIAASDASVSPVFEVSVSLRGALRLDQRNYLILTPLFSVPFSSGISPRFSLSLGTRTEIPWLGALPPAPPPLPRAKPLISAVPTLFSPDNDGIDDRTTLFITVPKPESVKSWKVTIRFPDGKTVKVFSGKGKPPDSLVWNGKSDTNAESEPAFNYRVMLESTDILGRTEKAETTVTIDILVIRDGDRFKIRVPDIRFPSYSWELSEKESMSLLIKNRAVLERIATLFTRFPDYRMIVEGHANAINWNDPEKMKREQEAVLIPLSQKRAETVKQALILLGVGPERISTAGLGAINPVAEFSDSENIWKNRRVEFILAR